MVDVGGLEPGLVDRDPGGADRADPAGRGQRDVRGVRGRAVADELGEIVAPRASACSRASRMTTAAPSPMTNPSRPELNGRDAASGSSFRVESARIAANPPTSGSMRHRLPSSAAPSSTACSDRMRRFAGRTLTLDSGSFDIVGILPADFVFPHVPHVDVLIPLRLDEATERGRVQMSILQVIGRMRADAALPQVKAELLDIHRRGEASAQRAMPPGGPARWARREQDQAQGLGGGRIQMRFEAPRVQEVREVRASRWVPRVLAARRRTWRRS